MSASSEFNDEQLPGAPATVDKQERRSRLRDASPMQYAIYACGMVSSGGIAIPDCNVPVPNLYRACSALSFGSRPEAASIASSCPSAGGTNKLRLHHAPAGRHSPTNSDEAYHAMLPPPVAVSRRRRTGSVSPEAPHDAAVGAPMGGGGGGGGASSSISEESDGTPVGPPPKKRRSGALS